MPHILVQHTEEVAGMDNGFMLGTLRKKLRHVCPPNLSVKQRQLLENDFSVMFLVAGPWDVLVKDIQVIVLLHADEERVQGNKPDELAEAIATAIEETVRFAPRLVEPREVSYSVSLHHGEMGYFSSSAHLGGADHPDPDE